MREAISFHLDGLREDGEPVPEPRNILHLCRTARIIGDERGGTTPLFCFELRFSIDNRATALPGTPATFAEREGCRNFRSALASI